MVFKAKIEINKISYEYKEKCYFLKRLKTVISNVTVEPMLLLYVLPSLMSVQTTQNLTLEKACRVDLKYNSSVCDAMMYKNSTNGYTEFQESETQKLASKMIALKNFLIGLFPIFLFLFLGSWSDRHGRRKPVIFISIFGDFLATLMLVICSYYLLEFPVLVSTLGEAIPTALGGTWACFYLGIYTYLGDVCSDEEKTTRIGIATTLEVLAMGSGITLAGILLSVLGYVKMYLIVSGSMAAALVYLVVRLKDENRKTEEITGSKKGCFVDFFDVKHIKNIFRVCFRSGSELRRLKIIILAVLLVTILGTFSGEIALAYLYTRIKLEWTEKNFGYFCIIRLLIHIIGSAIALTIFSNFLKLDDAWIGVIGFTSRFLGTLTLAFSTNDSSFYFGALLEMFSGTCIMAVRSIMSKIVPKQELGQTNSVFGLFEATLHTVFVPFYSFIYNSTIDFFPGAFFLASSFFNLLSLFLCVWLLNMKNENSDAVVTEEI